MSVSRRTLLFFDASCLNAAAGSPAGGSGFLLDCCRRGFPRGAVSQPVLIEVERNVSRQLGQTALDTYHTLLALTPLTIVPILPTTGRSVYAALVGEKDEHVLAATLAADADFLITLDKRLAAQVNEAGLDVTALSPGDFIKTVLPDHEEYRSIR